MKNYLLVPMLLASMSVAVAPALADSTVTATGSQQEKVVPKNRHNNASIVAAVNAAEQAGIAGAIANAHSLAEQYAAAAGLTLGDVQSVTDVSGNGYYGPYGPFGFGPFGPGKYCGTVVQVTFKKSHKKGKKPVISHRRKVHRCFVPQYEVTTLSVTYAASPSSSSTS